MQVKVKTKKTDIMMKGNISSEVLTALRKAYKKSVHILDDDGEELVIATETDWFEGIKKETLPGEIIKIYRENLTMTQAELGNKIDKTAQFISDLENGHRNISLKVAKKLAAFFEISIARLI